MAIPLASEHHDMREKVRAFACNVISPAIHRMEHEETFPSEIVKKMGQSGLLGIPVSKQWGGLGQDFISYIIAIEEISRVSATIGVILSVHTSVGTNPIEKYGTGEQKEKYLTKLASGEWLSAFALTEPQAGSDAKNIRLSAVSDGEHYVLNGSKVFITNAGAADTYIVFAVTDPQKETRGISAFIIEKNMPGFQVGSAEKKMGLHGSNTCELFFEDVKVPVSQRLGKEGDGYVIAMSNLDGGRIGISAQALGIASAALEYSIHYLKKAEVNKPAIQTKIADMAMRVKAARLLVYQAADLRNRGKPCTKEASMAKMFASDTAMTVSAEAIQISAQEGYSKQFAAERYFRDAKITQIYEGTNQIQRIVIANQIAKKV